MLYLIHGPEPVLCREAVATVKASILEGDPTAECETLDALAGAPIQVGATLTALSMFTPHRVITVYSAAGRPPKNTKSSASDQRDEEAFDDDADDDAGPDAPKEAISALNRQLRETIPRIPTTTDVLFVEYRKIAATMGLGKILHDEGKRWADAARQRGEHTPERARFIDMPVETKKGRGVVDWLRRKSTEESIVIDESALERLADAWSDNLTGAEQEIAKLRSYVGPSGHVTAAVVETLEADPIFGIFTLVDAVALRNLPLGMRAWKSLLAQGKEPLMVFAMIVRQFRAMLYAQLGIEAGLKEVEALNQGNTGVGGYAASKAIPQAKRLGTARLRHIYALLRDTDAAIKLGKTTPAGKDSDNVVVERLIFELCAPDAMATPRSWR